MANHELLKLTANQVKEGGYNKAILAIGSCEAHGKHLAEGTDTIVSYKLSCMIADKVDGLLVLPPVTVGYSAHGTVHTMTPFHSQYPLDMILSHRLFMT